jgi:ABC-type bacteriocin/lantibiotic exporter with double-glycine peptidase domain
MNSPEHRKRNRRLGIILCLLFAVLFIIATMAIVTGSKASPFVEKVVKGIGTPVLGVIGLLLVIAAVVEIVLRAVRNT